MSQQDIVKKSYERDDHNKIGNIILGQLDYIKDTFRDEEDPDRFARLPGEVLSMALMELTAMYESLSKWIADEKLHVADTKTAYDLKFADRYCELKQMKSETNETARMKARLMCGEDEKKMNKIRNDYDKVEAWKKVIGRYHDAVRSQLSYEKQMGGMSR